MTFLLRRCTSAVFFLGLILSSASSYAQILDKRKLLEEETFWDNRDFDWYEQNIPFLECPDREVTTTYYYRWELLTKHLTYGAPNSGYTFTEFIDRPFWSGAYGAISCPAGHQLYEARWLRSPRIANDYSKYWFRTPGAQPRNYSTWLADSIREVDKVHPNKNWLVDLLPDLIRNYEGWEQRHYVPEVGLFWQTGHDDGMEFNINSRQTKDILRGAPSYRPSFNAYMWADAKAISEIATIAGQTQVASIYNAKADAIRAKMLELMWDEKRQFFFPVLKNDETADAYTMSAMTRTYESGKYAGDSHGRELIGYVPWQFNLIEGESKYDVAWKKLMDRDGFYANFGPSTVERNDPLFLLKNSCCWWSGQSWPYATTQTLKALANYLQNGGKTLAPEDYVDLLSIYARSHRKDGVPYLAEALHPDSGSFEGHDAYNHSEHYLHSGYCDLVITGLVGLVPRSDDTLELRPLAPSDWDYFALDNLVYRGHSLAVVWDKTGKRYQLGAGMHVLIDGKKVFTSLTLEPVTLTGAVPVLKETAELPKSSTTQVNFAVNNDGFYYPRLTASYTSKGTSLSKANDGNYWYVQNPPNRWSCEGSQASEDWTEIDFGTERQIHTVKLFVLDDRNVSGSKIRAPKKIRIDYWNGSVWKSLDRAKEIVAPQGHRPHIFQVEALTTQKLKVTLEHADGFRSGLTEIEVWGDTELPVSAIAAPAGNLAFNDGSQDYPRATASHHDRFGGVPKSAIDGITNFLPTPTNRWTSYESKSKTDWLEIDFGKAIEFRRVDLAIYDDRGGVQAPVKFEIEVWQEGQWKSVQQAVATPESVTGSEWNSVKFQPVASSKLRIVFTHTGASRSGVTEVMVWNE
jgi:hypothetical protein